jgi:hypothetical protein
MKSFKTQIQPYNIQRVTILSNNWYAYRNSVLEEENMETKQQILTDLAAIFNRWQELLASLSEEQINQSLHPTHWTVKDVVAHMWAWQQASVARAEAALHDKQPMYPQWWEILGPNPEEDLDRTNTWLFEANLDKLWLKVYTDWKEQYQRFLKLTSQISEKDLLEVGKYTWMGGYALSASTMGSLGHHQEHYESLTAWLQEHETKKSDG